MKADKTHQRCRRNSIELWSTTDRHFLWKLVLNWLEGEVIKENDQEQNHPPVIKVLYFPNNSPRRVSGWKYKFKFLRRGPPFPLMDFARLPLKGYMPSEAASPLLTQKITAMLIWQDIPWRMPSPSPQDLWKQVEIWSWTVKKVCRHKMDPRLELMNSIGCLHPAKHSPHDDDDV